MNKMIIFLHILKTTSLICTGVHFKTFTGKRNLRVSRSSMCTFSFKDNRHETILQQEITSSVLFGYDIVQNGMFWTIGKQYYIGYYHIRSYRKIKV